MPMGFALSSSYRPGNVITVCPWHYVFDSANVRTVTISYIVKTSCEGSYEYMSTGTSSRTLLARHEAARALPVEILVQLQPRTVVLSHTTRIAESPITSTNYSTSTYNSIPTDSTCSATQHHPSADLQQNPPVCTGGTHLVSLAARLVFDATFVRGFCSPTPPV